jgi:hypothetical protein
MQQEAWGSCFVRDRYLRRAWGRSICIHRQCILKRTLRKGIVRDQVDARYLLVHLVDVGEDNSVELAVFGHLEQAAVRALGHFNDSLLHVVELGDNVGVVAVQIVDVFQDFKGFLFSALHDEPTGALGQVQDHAEDDQTEEDLECQREPPGDLVLTDPSTVLCQRLIPDAYLTSHDLQAIVDPVADGDAGGDQHAFDHDKLATLVGLCCLTLPHGDGRGVHSVSPSSDQSSNDPLRKVVSCTLKQRANGHDNRSVEDGPLAPKCVADEDGEHSTAEAAQVVRSHGDTLVRRTSRGREGGNSVGGCVDRWEIFDETRQIQETSCYTLVVTKESVCTRSVLLDVEMVLSSNLQEIQTSNE